MALTTCHTVCSMIKHSKSSESRVFFSPCCSELTAEIKVIEQNQRRWIVVFCSTDRVSESSPPCWPSLHPKNPENWGCSPGTDALWTPSGTPLHLHGSGFTHDGERSQIIFTLCHRFYSSVLGLWTRSRECLWPERVICAETCFSTLILICVPATLRTKGWMYWILWQLK